MEENSPSYLQLLKTHLHGCPSCSDSSRQGPSHSFKQESREMISQLQNECDQRLCLNLFKLCNWFASGRTIAESKSLIGTVFFDVFGNSKLSRTEFVLISFLRLMLSFEHLQSLVTDDYTMTKSQQLERLCKLLDCSTSGERFNAI